MIETGYSKGVAPAVQMYQNERRSSMGGQKPPIPPRPGQNPALPPRTGNSPQPLSAPPRLPPRDTGAIGEKVPLPNASDTLLAGPSPIFSEKPGSASARAGAPEKGKRPFLNRLLLAGEVILDSVETSAHDLINSGSAAASSAAG